jgi:hypothetical protein
VGSLIESRARAGGIITDIKRIRDDGQLSADEVEYVMRATPVWLTPAVETIENIVSSEVDVGPGIDLDGRALSIHLAELADEVRKGDRRGCIRELEEYVETLDRVLSKEGLARFVHGRRWNGKAWVDM